MCTNPRTITTTTQQGARTCNPLYSRNGESVQVTESAGAGVLTLDTVCIESASSSVSVASSAAVATMLRPHSTLRVATSRSGLVCRPTTRVVRPSAQHSRSSPKRRSPPPPAPVATVVDAKRYSA
jgi:hypothetical protein